MHFVAQKCRQCHSVSTKRCTRSKERTPTTKTTRPKVLRGPLRRVGSLEHFYQLSSRANTLKDFRKKKTVTKMTGRLQWLPKQMNINPSLNLALETPIPPTFFYHVNCAIILFVVLLLCPAQTHWTEHSFYCRYCMTLHSAAFKEVGASFIPIKEEFICPRHCCHHYENVNILDSSAQHSTDLWFLTP
ncbi:hypothetical protein BC940DRAFT_113618 [Gongronella butleri]|nr:hypothetical protein BC940DRAFT_113618 [Gongronella butleri]